MRLEQLEYLIEIAKQNSMNIASEQLHLAPQTLSISMKNLEKEMGFAIFDHTSKGTTLTRNGELVLRFALKTVSDYRAIIAQCATTNTSTVVQTTSSELHGKLIIYCNPIFTTTSLPYYTRIFLNVYPKIKLTTLPRTTQQICETIYQSNIEKNIDSSVLGIVVLPFCQNTLVTEFLPNNSNLIFKPFGCSQYYCCVPKNSPLAKHQTLSIHKLLNHRLILYTASECPMTPLVYALQQYGTEPDIALSVSSIPFWVQAIQDGLGIGFINSLMLSENSYLKEHLNQLQFIRVKEPLLSINGFLYENPLDPITKAFIDLWPDYHPSKAEPKLSDLELSNLTLQLS